MLSLISKLQRKPEHVRKKIALITSAAVTAVIVLFWLVSISLKEPSSPVPDSEPSPLAALGAGIGSIVDDAKDVLTKMKETFSASSYTSATSSESEAETPVSE